MSYDVTSFFRIRSVQQNAQWVRRLTVGGSNYSDKVIKWPRVERRWNEIKPGTITIDLTNEDRTFNFFISDKTKLRNACAVGIGFVHSGDGTIPTVVNTDYVIPAGQIFNSQTGSTTISSGYSITVNGTWVDSTGDVSSFEAINAFSGRVDAVRFQDGKATLTLIDKFKQLADRVVGDQTSPVIYTGSSYLVHDLAWYICTSHGGLSATLGIDNPDIDYASFLEWTAVFSTDNIRLRGRFSGQRPSELLKRISDLTQSAIWIEGDKLKFVRFQLSQNLNETLNNDNIISADHLLDDRSLINKFYAGADYDVTSKYHKITCVDVATGSVNSFGLREENSYLSDVWLVDSVSALNLSQRMINTYSTIKGKFMVEGPLAMGASAGIGDAVTYVDSFLAANDSYRVMRESIDIDRGLRILEIDQTQIFDNFILDVSELDGTDVLG